MKKYKWFQEMELTKRGKEHLKSFRIEARRAFFVGFTGTGFIRILSENTSTAATYFEGFWQAKKPIKK